MNIANLDYIKGLKSADFPDLGAKLYEALRSIATQAGNIEQQTNSNPSGQPTPPSAPNALTVSGQNGHFNIAIQDHNQNVYRGVKYFVEHADNPQFTNAQVIDLGTSRNHNVFLGNVTRYWRAYSSYASSAPSTPVYHGTATAPLAVTGGGAVGGPEFQAAQSSGTSVPNQGGPSGPGHTPYRTATGAPPTR